MKLDAARLAELLDGTVQGRGDQVIEALSPLDQAHPTAIAPLFARRYLDGMKALPGAVLCSADLAPQALTSGILAAVVHPAPQAALAKLIDLFYPPEPTDPVIPKRKLVFEQSDRKYPVKLISTDAKLLEQRYVAVFRIFADGSGPTELRGKKGDLVPLYH